MLWVLLDVLLPELGGLGGVHRCLGRREGHRIGADHDAGAEVELTGDHQQGDEGHRRGQVGGHASLRREVSAREVIGDASAFVADRKAYLRGLLGF